MTTDGEMDDFDVDEIVDDLIRRMKNAERKPLSEEDKERALQALAEIQRAVQESGVTEEELQEEGRRIRKELTRQKYPRAPSDEKPI